MFIASLLFAASLALPQAPDTLATAKVIGSRSTVSVSSTPVQRVSSSFISNTGAVSLQEALKTFSGISVKDYGGIGGLKTVDIRSFGAQHTGISYDGITVSNAQNGQVDIGRFNLDTVQSIELNVTGSDDIFRSARLASYVGTLVINSSRPVLDSCGTRVTAQMRVASFSTSNPYISLEQRLGKRWVSAVSANLLNSRGDYPFILHNGNLTTTEQRLNSDVKALDSEARVYGDLGRGGDIVLKAAIYASERGLPGSVVLYTQDPTERLWDRDISASATHTAQFGNQWKLRSSLSWASQYNRYTNTDKAYQTPVEDIYLQNEATLSSVLLWNAGGRLQASLAEDLSVSHLDANILNCLYPTRETSYTALSGKYESDRLTTVATLLATVVREQTRIGDPAPARNRVSPGLSVSYKMFENRDVRLRASLKESYRLPTFNDIYYPRVGNKNLEPEKAYQANLGLTWSKDFGKTFVQMTADSYHNLVKDKIVAVPTMFIWSMRNVGLVSMSGCDIDASLDKRFNGSLRLRLNAGYAWQHAIDITDPEAKNYRDQIAYTPRHTGKTSAILETAWVNVGYTLNAVGERYSLSQNTAAYRIEPYYDHGVSINRTFRFGLEHKWDLHLSAEALNLSGKNYEVIKYYPMPGRNYRFTIKITY
ncbi:MAG: TonB-dependent receptor [Bacteroidia bacterium]|nr:TonB-dependent receptor [Bacteroidia bacterium]